MSERDRAMEQGSTGLGESAPRARDRKGPASPIYSVELEVFEGPLDLLLHLVRKHELDILDIPIAFVATKYLEYLDVMRQLDLEIAGDYLVMAATLAYLKSRELLPPEPRAGEAGTSEEEEGEDPREALIRRLVEYERFKQAAVELDSLPMSGRDVFARGAELVMPPIDPGLAPVSLFNLAEAYYRVLTRAKVKSTHDVQIEAVTVAQRIKQLALMLDEKPHFEFEELFLGRTWNSERELRSMLVVTLMSILEMVKLGVAGVQQPLDSTTIRIYRRASAEETQQALADYDEDESFGAPKPKEGEEASAAAPPPRRVASEAELDAVEEATLLAEALAGVQEPEEPVLGYADEDEGVAANDPASDYDDEPDERRATSRSGRTRTRTRDQDEREDDAAAEGDARDATDALAESPAGVADVEHVAVDGAAPADEGEPEFGTVAAEDDADEDDARDPTDALAESTAEAADGEGMAVDGAVPADEGDPEFGAVAAERTPEALAPGREDVFEDSPESSADDAAGELADVDVAASARDVSSFAGDAPVDGSVSTTLAPDVLEVDAPRTSDAGRSEAADDSSGESFEADEASSELASPASLDHAQADDEDDATSSSAPPLEDGAQREPGEAADAATAAFELDEAPTELEPAGLDTAGETVEVLPERASAADDGAARSAVEALAELDGVGELVESDNPFDDSANRAQGLDEDAAGTATVNASGTAIEAEGLEESEVELDAVPRIADVDVDAVTAPVLAGADSRLDPASDVGAHEDLRVDDSTCAAEDEGIDELRSADGELDVEDGTEPAAAEGAIGGREDGAATEVVDSLDEVRAEDELASAGASVSRDEGHGEAFGGSPSAIGAELAGTEGGAARERSDDREDSSAGLTDEFVAVGADGKAASVAVSSEEDFKAESDGFASAVDVELAVAGLEDGQVPDVNLEVDGYPEPSEAGDSDVGALDEDVLEDRQSDAAENSEALAVEDDEASTDETSVAPSTETPDAAGEAVRSDSDEEAAGGLFLNTGEGLGARELGEDDDEDDAQ